jgi:CHAD domain-containing protein
VRRTQSARAGGRAGDPAAALDRTRKIVSARCRDVLKSRRRVLRRGDAEAIHDLRVATRRLQATLEFAGERLPDRPRRRLDRRARTLRRRLGTARNACVLLGLLGTYRSVSDPEERTFIKDLARRLERSAATRPRKDRRDLPGIRKRIRTLLREMSRRSAVSAAPARQAVLRLVQAVLHARTHTRAGDPESMHRMRIAIKRYRYALEAMAEAGTPRLRPAIHAARSLQGDLGRLHDLDVLIEVVRREVEAPGAGGFLRRILRQRGRQVAKAMRRLAGFRPAFAASAGRAIGSRFSGDGRGAIPREAQSGRTAA